MSKSWRYDPDENPVDRQSMKRKRKLTKQMKREAERQANEVFDVLETVDDEWGGGSDDR